MGRYLFPILISLCILANALPGWWDWGYFAEGRRWYYLMQAVSWYPLLGAMFVFNKEDKIHITSARVLFWFLCMNTIDELFGNPVHFGVYEVIAAIIILAIEIFIRKKG